MNEKIKKSKNYISTDSCCAKVPESDKDRNCCTEQMGELVQRLVRVMNIFEKDSIKAFGFTSSQCYSLLHLNRNGNLSMNQLSEKMNLSMSTMTRIINNLVRDGFILRERDETDKRVVNLRLTDKGVKGATILRKAIQEYYKNIVGNLPNGQVEEIMSSMSVMLNILEKLHPGCC